MRATRRKAAGLALALAVLGTTGCSGSEGGGSEEAFCAQVERMPSLSSALTNFVDRDPQVLRARLAEARASYEALAEAAPDPVRGDTRDVVDLVDVVIDAVDAHPDDNEAAAAQVRTALADHPDVAEAGARVSAYAKSACGVDLDPAPAEVTTTTAGG